MLSQFDSIAHGKTCLSKGTPITSYAVLFFNSLRRQRVGGGGQIKPALATLLPVLAVAAAVARVRAHMQVLLLVATKCRGFLLDPAVCVFVCVCARCMDM